MKGVIVNLVIFATAAIFHLCAATTIEQDTKGAILNKASAEASGIPQAQVFDSLNRDQVYVNIKTAGTLIHIRADQVVKYVFFLKKESFPSKLLPDDLAAIKAKLDELHAFSTLSPAAEKAAASYTKSLQALYDSESVKYKQSASEAANAANTAKQQADFDKKCELMRLDLLANKDNIQRSEEIVKTMEPLAARSQMLASVLAKWNEEKSRAQQLAEEGKKIWGEAQKTHPECFVKHGSVQEIPDFPADLKAKAADLYQRLDQCRVSATYPQTITYCQAEIPAYFILTQLPKIVEKIKERKYEEAITIAQKASTQVNENQIVEPYGPVYDAFKNDRDLVLDFHSGFETRLAKLKQSEPDYTDTELLAEYQKLYDLVPDPKVAARIQQLKAKINSK